MIVVRVLKKVSVIKAEIDEIYCNKCGSKIEKDSFGNFSDHLHIEKAWGYHSDKDGQIDSFDLCEKCYNELINNFKISPYENK